MSNDPYRAPGGGGGVDDLQFDRAEPSPPRQPAGVGEPVAADSQAPVPPPGVTACAACGEPISDVYFEANGKVVCPRCREAVLAAHASGNPFARFLKSLALGIVAAVIGAAVWWGIRAATGWSIGLIAILLGLFVGGAVRLGAEGRGGLGYQLLAVVLTYLAVAGSWVPVAFQEFRQQSDNPVAIAVATVVASVIQPVAGASVIGWLILGFALWEAFRINRPARLSFNGPYRLAGGAPPPMPRA